MADLTTTPVATQIQPPKGMSLANMVNLAGGIQAYQQSQLLNPLQLQKAQLELQQAQQTSSLAVREAAARTSTAETGSKKASSELNAYYQDQTRKTYGGLLTDPDFNPKNPNPEAIKEKLNEAKDYLVNVIGVPEHESKMHDKLLEHIDKHGAAGAQRVIQTIANGVQQAGTNTEQFGQVNKAPTYINQGQYAVPVYTSPYQSGGPGQAPAVQMQLPPTTEIVNAETGEKELIGNTPIINRKLTTALGPAQAATQEAAGNVVKSDILQTMSDASAAQNRIATFQKIKQLTPESFTGVGGERKKFLSGLAQSVGIPVAELETSSTDELAKNSKLLALAGGNTDAARSIAEMATPNAKMTKEAMLRVSDQLIGMEKMKLAKAAYLSSSINNPAEYKRKLDTFNNFSDFRLFQEMTPEEVAKLKASMSPAQQQEMSNKIKQARALGIIQ